MSSMITDEQALDLMVLQSTGGIKSLSDVKKKILGLSEYLGQLMIASNLQNYNRRFARHALKHGSDFNTVMRELVQDHGLSISNVANVNWVLPACLESHTKDMAEMKGIDVFEARDQVTDLMIRNGRKFLGLQSKS